MYRMDIWDHNRTIDRHSCPKYQTQNKKHWFQNDRYCNLQSVQKCIAGCSISDFNQILLSNSKIQSIIRIYRRTHWTTRLQPTQFRLVGRFPSNRTRIDSSGVWGPEPPFWRQFGSDPGPELLRRSITIAKSVNNWLVTMMRWHPWYGQVGMAGDSLSCQGNM